MDAKFDGKLVRIIDHPNYVAHRQYIGSTGIASCKYLQFGEVYYTVDNFSCLNGGGLIHFVEYTLELVDDDEDHASWSQVEIITKWNPTKVLEEIT